MQFNAIAERNSVINNKHGFNSLNIAHVHVLYTIFLQNNDIHNNDIHVRLHHAYMIIPT